MRSNQVRSGDYIYTRPAQGEYERQWLWDSCFHSIILSHIDPKLAVKEIESAAAGQLTEGVESGMIPHMNNWESSARDPWESKFESSITQPPLLAVALSRVADSAAEMGLLEDLYRRISDYHDWFERRRTTSDSDPLVAIIHPWESGWDGSQRWDAELELDGTSDSTAQIRRRVLMDQLNSTGTDLAAVIERKGFVVKPPDFNAIRSADLKALSGLASRLGKVEEAAEWLEKSEAVARAISQRMWDADSSSFRDLRGSEEKLSSVDSAASFVTLISTAPTAEQRTAIIDRLTSEGYWSDYPVPTSPVKEPHGVDFDPDRYWRGNVWPQLNWIIHNGLKQNGQPALAAEIATRSFALAKEHGFYEYYNPINGRGLGAKNQSWAALVVDMISD